jgi:YegS/Rv2252/BmrU family lipid kinase
MITVLINPSGGTASDPHAIPNLQRLLAEHLPQASVEVVDHAGDLAERARAACAAGARVVAAAGGDGTLNAVAQVLVRTDVRLGILPFGTRNHFARDVGVPVDLAQAVALLGTDTMRRIDVGQVNNHYFLNNASIGLYPELVHLREQEAKSLSKALRLLLATVQLIRRARPIAIELCYADQCVREPIWLVFVGNNSYHLGVFRAGQRTRLDSARLDVVVVPARRWRLVRLALQRSDAHLRHVVRAEVESTMVQVLNTTSCSVACDGEALKMTPPFAFRSVPGALWVVAPT